MRICVRCVFLSSEKPAMSEMDQEPTLITHCIQCETHTLLLCSIVLYCACSLTVTGSVKRSLHKARCVIVAHRIWRLQANFHASAKEEFYILNYPYLINNDPPPCFIGWVVRRGRVIDRPVNCQTDEILQFWHRRKSTFMWLTTAPPPSHVNPRLHKERSCNTCLYFPTAVIPGTIWLISKAGQFTDWDAWRLAD